MTFVNNDQPDIMDTVYSFAHTFHHADVYPGIWYMVHSGYDNLTFDIEQVVQRPARLLQQLFTVNQDNDRLARILVKILFGNAGKNNRLTAPGS